MYISVWVIVLRSKFFFCSVYKLDFISYDYFQDFLFVNFVVLEIFGIFVIAYQVSRFF
jgi:hypothetical protein